MIRYTLILGLAAIFASVAAPLLAKDHLGVYSNWAAFRDDAPSRCYAIAKPDRGGDTGPFASVANWPVQNIRGQIHIRLSRSIADDAGVRLTIGDRRFDLAANRNNAWAQDQKMDAAIIAAMRSASRMTVSAQDSRGRRFSDRYNLSGASTAIDAAVVGCANFR